MVHKQTFPHLPVETMCPLFRNQSAQTKDTHSTSAKDQPKDGNTDERRWGKAHMIVNPGCQFDDIQNYHGNQAGLWKVLQIRLLRQGDIRVSFHGPSSDEKVKNQLNTRILYSLPSECGHHVTSCLLVSRPSHAMTVSPETEQNMPFLPFCYAMRQVTNRAHGNHSVTNHDIATRTAKMKKMGSPKCYSRATVGSFWAVSNKADWVFLP